jgi:hypothetical protein
VAYSSSGYPPTVARTVAAWVPFDRGPHHIPFFRNRGTVERDANPFPWNKSNFHRAGLRGSFFFAPEKKIRRFSCHWEFKFYDSRCLFVVFAAPMLLVDLRKASRFSGKSKIQEANY